MTFCPAGTASGRGKLALWLFLTYALSALCYLPQILQQGGADVPEALLYLKNGFIFVPILISTAFLLHERRFLSFWREGVTGFSRKELLVCATVVPVGFFTTLAYSFFSKTNVYGSTYPSVPALAGTCIYLLCTAFLEEAAWRGFFLRRLAEGGKEEKSLLIGGIAWAFWHIPMWTAHGLPAVQQVQLWIWAVLVGVVLGKLYLHRRSFLSAALCHMIFNVCFLAPAVYNIAVLAVVLAGCFIFKKTCQKA